MSPAPDISRPSLQSVALNLIEYYGFLQKAMKAGKHDLDHDISRVLETICTEQIT